MVRGTTPTFILTLDDVDLTGTNVYVTFKQDKGDCPKGLLLTKTGDDLTIEENVVSVYLSQEETLRFARGKLYIQVNWTFDNGKRACSEIALVKVDNNLLNGVLQ